MGSRAAQVPVIRSDQIWLVWEPVDMRAGMDRLSAWVQDSLGRSPCDGSAFVFRNRRATRLKLLLWDGNGVWCCQRRLHQGVFTWPSPGEPVHSLSQEQWNWLIAGVDWTRLNARPNPAWKV